MLPLPRPAPSPLDRDAVFARLVPLVIGWCTRLGAGTIDAEAAASDALLVLLRRFDAIEPGAPVEAWAWGVVRNVVREHRRRVWWRRWIPGAPMERAAPESGAPARRERVRLVYKVLSSLSEPHREVIVLVDLEERPASEVATLIGVPEGTVRSRLRLARAAFREQADRLGLGPVHLAEEGYDV